MPGCAYPSDTIAAGVPAGRTACETQAATKWRLPCAVLLMAALMLGGCSKSHTRFKHPRFMSKQDCAACLEVALDAESPDARREAILHVSKTSYLANDVVIRALATIARTDASDSVRYAAVQALAKSGAPEAVEPLLDIVSAPLEAGLVTRPQAGDVRWAALEGLDHAVSSGQLSDQQRQTCEDAAIHWLGRHRSRDVRISAARMLRHSPSEATLTALIDAVEQRDFGVAYHSERSLMHLTGQTFDHDAAAWRKWRAATDDPFAGAGQLDHELYPEEENWWERTVNGTRRALAGFRPKSP